MSYLALAPKAIKVAMSSYRIQAVTAVPSKKFRSILMHFLFLLFFLHHSLPAFSRCSCLDFISSLVFFTIRMDFLFSHRLFYEQVVSLFLLYQFVPVVLFSSCAHSARILTIAGARSPVLLPFRWSSSSLAFAEWGLILEEQEQFPHNAKRKAIMALYCTSTFSLRNIPLLLCLWYFLWWTDDLNPPCAKQKKRNMKRG